MKKRFWSVLATVLLVAAVPVTYALDSESFEDKVFSQDEVTFFEVDVEEVPEVVTEAAGEENPGADVVKAELAYIGGEQVYKLTMKKDDEDHIALYKSDGSKYNPEG